METVLYKLPPSSDGDTPLPEGLTWDASGAVSKDPMAFVIQDGVYARP